MGAPEQVGRAIVIDNDDGTQLWRLAPGDRELAPWLVWIGQQGIGGFTQSGEDAQGPWVLRGVRPQPMSNWLETLTEPLDWRPAVELVRRLAALNALCEAQSIFPGPLNPHNVLYSPASGAVELNAETLVRSLVGGSDDGETRQSLSSRWVAPEQASGARWDHAGNRYVVGLVLYRLLSGEHPFSGMGLRHGVEQARRGASPMRDAIATRLPPGLQSYCLRLLDPEAAARPHSFQGIVDKLAELLGMPEQPSAAHMPVFSEARSLDAMVSQPAATPVASSTTPSSTTPKSRAVPRLLAALTVVVPIVVGVGGAAIVLSRVDGASLEQTPKVRVEARDPLTPETTTASDCAGCHPRQTAQWHRSVMGHSAKSPLFQALEIAIQEQVGRGRDCEHGAGILRSVDPKTACRVPGSNIAMTGAGGELWCVNCHLPVENLAKDLPAWDGIGDDARTRLPLRDLASDAKMEGIGCAFCHQVHGPVLPGNTGKGEYEGNPTWTSLATGKPFFMRPEDLKGRPGIANSGYFLDAEELLAKEGDDASRVVPGAVHRRPTDEARAYVRSSEFCGSCHDVRLFGTDGLGIRNGEHFKRLRNAYSEWAAWAEDQRAAGKAAASCQDCHMSLFPGVCVAGPPDIDPSARTRTVALERACPPGTHFESREPGTYPTASMAAGTGLTERLTMHYFTGVDVPLTPEFDDAFIDQETLDGAGIPLGAEQRRDILLGRSFRFEIEGERLVGSRLELPIIIENASGGHRIPAGFSQEREIWVHLTVTDAEDRVVYEVGKVGRGDEDLADKVFVRINVDDTKLDDQGRPLGVFGADVENGPDHPEWTPDPAEGGTEFRGHGLINFQNGFLRCVRCIGDIDLRGRCQPKASQRGLRAARFEDGAFDIDTGICDSNLTGMNAYYETYFPVGSLDAERGTVRGPDVIIDTRSAPPGVPIRYVYDVPVGGFSAPLRVEARLMFRAFPPFLIRGFADYEALQAKQGLRPSGPLVTHDMLERLEAVELVRVVTRVSR